MIIISYEQVSQKEAQLKNEEKYLNFHWGTIFNKLLYSTVYYLDQQKIKK